MIDEETQNDSKNLLASSEPVILNGSACDCAKLKQKAFTLVEILIVVAILGILAAIVMPEFKGHIQKAKESSAKDNLRILRNAIQLYAVEHGDVPPGYPNDDSTQTPGYLWVKNQLTISNHYISNIPENPLNGHSAVYTIPNSGTISDGMAIGTPYGWVYQPSTKTIKLNYSGTDSQGKDYFTY